MKNSVLFPGLLMPLAVGRPASVAAVEAALATEDKEVIVVAQSDPTVDTPHASDLYTVGTRAVIRKSGRPRRITRHHGAGHRARGGRQGGERTDT